MRALENAFEFRKGPNFGFVKLKLPKWHSRRIVRARSLPLDPICEVLVFGGGWWLCGGFADRERENLLIVTLGTVHNGEGTTGVTLLAPALYLLPLGPIRFKFQKAFVILIRGA